MMRLYDNTRCILEVNMYKWVEVSPEKDELSSEDISNVVIFTMLENNFFEYDYKLKAYKVENLYGLLEACEDWECSSLFNYLDYDYRKMDRQEEKIFEA